MKLYLLSIFCCSLLIPPTVLTKELTLTFENIIKLQDLLILESQDLVSIKKEASGAASDLAFDKSLTKDDAIYLQTIYSQIQLSTTLRGVAVHFDALTLPLRRAIEKGEYPNLSIDYCPQTRRYFIVKNSFRKKTILSKTSLKCQK